MTREDDEHQIRTISEATYLQSNGSGYGSGEAVILQKDNRRQWQIRAVFMDIKMAVRAFDTFSGKNVAMYTGRNTTLEQIELRNYTPDEVSP